ncbi:YbhB/YbcL family Raf kinase inhibitor-like protein [Geomonas sp. Red32]|uniref:YbhB/YbcL family Raf kinase inhibitor-like protein n=1 Tax=Geomonas sp. Red32 TaxID=2912856 RepID=UPI00202CACCF|nr:YbhB/YbcL family Raf kinase inhibitor-like protein [Geomonas sp. Red32]MCM0084471.1 YbhB/YbcL family Raf kinase inhibitor-like protein [Geomonas sp. Red32]
MEFKLTSSAFNNSTLIPSKYTCDGDNVNPYLAVHGVPAEAKSLALVVADPDAPSGLYIHWLLWNIPVEVKEIHAVEGLNSNKSVGYEGPSPPSGTHRYFFRLYALDIKLHLEEGALRSDLIAAMEGHILATAELMGTYSRTNNAPV